PMLPVFIMHRYRQSQRRCRGISQLFEAWVVLFVVRFISSFVTTSRVMKETARLKGLSSSRKPIVRRSPESVAWAVRVAGERVGATCLTQALAVQFLLSRSGCPSDLRIGVTREDDGRFFAQAWVAVVRQSIICGATAGRYAAR